jgi:hypothetical protein
MMKEAERRAPSQDAVREDFSKMEFSFLFEYELVLQSREY